MRIDNVSFPYPVLGISDDITPSLEDTGCANPNISVTDEGDCFLVNVELKLTNSDILEYIRQEKAEYTVEVHCRSTLYRNRVPSPEPVFSFKIKKVLLNDKLEFESFVVAKSDISEYKNAGLNPDYEGHIINLHKGDILVAYRKCAIPINIDLRNVRNMKSFMKVIKNENPNEHSVIYGLDGQKILIILPEEMMIEYNKKPSQSSAEEENHRRTILKASLYLEALTFALLNYKKHKDDGYMWVNALTYRMQEPDIREFCENLLANDGAELNYDDLFKLAHMMLNQPYLSMLKQISVKNDQFGPILTEG